MKIRSLLAALLFLTLVSCDKEKDLEETVSPAKTLFKYKANGTQFELGELDNVKIEPEYYNSTIIAYKVSGWKSSIENGVRVEIGRSSSANGNWLTVGTYEYTYPNGNLGEASLNGVGFIGKSSGDFSKVTITSIKDGYADGTFSARYSGNTNSILKVSITEGEFKHIKILQ